MDLLVEKYINSFSIISSCLVMYREETTFKSYVWYQKNCDHADTLKLFMTANGPIRDHYQVIEP